jgi:cardiolipin synthase
MKLIYKGENILNVPNGLSFYRLLIFPVILIFVIQGFERLFVIFICVSLVTDVLDGFIARRFNQQTRFGLALDNLADVLTLITAVAGIFAFKWEAVKDHTWVLYVFIGIFIISYIIAFVRFRKIPGLHLYLSVTAGYIQGIFLFVLFAFDFYLWFYYLAMFIGTLAYVEKILVLFKLDDIKPGVKGLYWLMQKKNQE